MSNLGSSLGRLSCSQVLVSLPRGVSKRLYTAPHSLLDAYPSQYPSQAPKQLLDTPPASSSSYPTANSALIQPFQEQTAGTLLSANAPREIKGGSSPSPVSATTAAADISSNRRQQPFQKITGLGHAPAPSAASASASVSPTLPGAGSESVLGRRAEDAWRSATPEHPKSAAPQVSAYDNSRLPDFPSAPSRDLSQRPAAQPANGSWHDHRDLTQRADAAPKVSRRKAFTCFSQLTCLWLAA